MATLAESFLADLDDLSDESEDEGLDARQDGEDVQVLSSIARRILLYQAVLPLVLLSYADTQTFCLLCSCIKAI